MNRPAGACEKFSGELAITVTQNPADLSRGTVTIQGTANPRLDGVPLPATFLRRRLRVTHDTSNLPAMCIDQTTTTLDVDLAPTPTGKLTFLEVRALSCPPSQAYCKGQLSLDLSPGK